MNRAPLALVAALVLLAAVLPYLPGLPGEFVYDDHRLIVENDGLKRPLDLRRAFLRDYYASDLDRKGLGYYRPVAILSNEFDYRRGGGEPGTFHGTNLALHALASLLVFALARSLFGGGAGPAAAGILFALHPAHAESVAFISGRVDPLATVFVLAALLAHRRGRAAAGWRLAAAFAWLLALLSKEMAVTMPVLAILLDLAEEGRPRGRWRSLIVRYLPYGIVAAVYLSLRVAALGRLLGAPTGEASLDPLRPFATLGAYLPWLLVPPPGLHLEPAAPEGWGTAAAVATLAGTIALGGWWLRTGRILAASLVGWVLVTLLPVAQLRPIETELSERFLYLPSGGAMLLVGLAVARLGRRSWIGAAALAVILGVVYVAILVPRAATWRDEVSLWRAKEQEEEGSLKARINLGRAHARRGEPAEAERWYESAIALAPALEPGLRAELDSLTKVEEDPEDSIVRALETLPEDGALWNNLGWIRLQKDDSPGAGEAFSRSVEFTPMRGEAWLGLSMVAMREGRFAEAETTASRAATIDPALGLARAIVGESRLRLGRPCEALEAIRGLDLDSTAENQRLARLRDAAREACGDPRLSK